MYCIHAWCNLVQCGWNTKQKCNAGMNIERTEWHLRLISPLEFDELITDDLCGLNICSFLRISVYQFVFNALLLLRMECSNGYTFCVCEFESKCQNKSHQINNIHWIVCTCIICMLYCLVEYLAFKAFQHGDESSVSSTILATAYSWHCLN